MDSVFRENKGLPQLDAAFLIKQLPSRIISYDRKEIVLRSDEESRIGYVMDGIVYLCVEDDFLERDILHIFRPGEFFISPMPTGLNNGISYLMSKYPTTVAYLNKSDLQEFYINNPKWTDTIINLIFEKFNEAMLRHNYILHQRTIRNKLICFFNDEYDRQQKRRIKLPVPYSDLADYLSVERTAMMKELAKMKSDGIISGKNREVTLYDNAIFNE